MLVKGDKKFGREITRILIIQLGDIGDVVWATPMFRAVKGAYPQAAVSVLVREDLGALLEADPSLHKIFEVKRYKGNLIEKIRKNIRFLRTLRQEHLDLVLDVRLDDRGAFMAFFTGAPIRISIFHRNIPWRNRLFTHLIDPYPPNAETRAAAEQSLQIVRAFGIDVKDTIPKLWVGDKTVEKMRRLLSREGVAGTKDYVSINPFSRWPYKEWNREKWIQIIDWLWNDYKVSAVIVGSSEEKEGAEYIKNHSCGQVFNLTGKTTLGELAGLLSLSLLHIGVDSAAPHIAAALGTPTVTIYGPSVWREWAPPGALHSVITPDRDCAPCHQRGCDGSGVSKCLEELTVEKVRGAIQEFLGIHRVPIHRGA